MKKLLILAITLSLLSCSTQRKFSPSKKNWDCLTILGTYDTSCVIKENWLHGSTTIIYLQDDSCIVIWGKKCEFNRGDSLYAKAEWWATPPGGSHWKYFLIIEDDNIRYTLLKP